MEPMRKEEAYLILNSEATLVEFATSATQEQKDKLYQVIQRDAMMHIRLISLLVLDASTVVLSGFAPNKEAVKKQEASLGTLQQFIVGYMNYVAAIANQIPVYEESPLMTLVCSKDTLLFERLTAIKHVFPQYGHLLTKNQLDKFTSEVYGHTRTSRQKPESFLLGVEILGLIKTTDAGRYLRNIEDELEDSVRHFFMIDPRFIPAVQEAREKIRK